MNNSIAIKFNLFKFTADPGGKGPHFCLTSDKITFRLIDSLRSWRYCVGAKLKFWRRSRVPKKRSRDEAVVISRGFAARDGSAVKSHSTILQRLRRQISLDYYTIPPATQATFLAVSTTVVPVFCSQVWPLTTSQGPRIP